VIVATAKLAAARLLVHEFGGPAGSDAIASLLIGLLLCATAVGLGAAARGPAESPAGVDPEPRVSAGNRFS
jgi:hypothetical protein